MKYQTLHCHTTTSDGLLTHTEVLKICETKGINTVAFTDHDAVFSKSVIDQIKGYTGPVRWISGIEVSSGMPKEMSGLEGGVHITGLFVDPQNPDLMIYCREAQKSRIERMKRIVRNLSDLGFDINEKDCLEASGGESVGRPHIVKALKSKKKNLEVIEALRKKMEDKARENEAVRKKYEEMMARGEDQYPYVLFLSNDSFVPGIYVNYLNRIDMDKCVALIRRAGGVAILAHWFTDKNKIDAVILERLFRENRLDGVETIYGMPEYPREELMKDRRILKKILIKYSKVESGGVDAHHKGHFDLFIENKWYSDMTVGLAEKIIEKTGVVTTWSSLGKNTDR